MAPGFPKKNTLPPISIAGRRRPCEWGRAAGRSALAVKSTARLRPITSVSQIVSEWLMTTHMEPESNPVNALSPMHAPLLPTLERVQHPNGRSSRQSPRPRNSPPRQSPCRRTSPHGSCPRRSLHLCRSPCPCRPHASHLPHTHRLCTILIISIPLCLSQRIILSRRIPGPLLRIIPPPCSLFQLTLITCSLGNEFVE